MNQTDIKLRQNQPDRFEIAEVDANWKELDDRTKHNDPQYNSIALLGALVKELKENPLAGVELGETETTAYRGDRGKTAYDHSQATHAPSDAQKNVKSDWNAISGDKEIENKPTIIEISDTETVADKTWSSAKIDEAKLDKVETGSIYRIYSVNSVNQQEMIPVEEEFIDISIESAIVTLITGATYTNKIANITPGSVSKGRKYVDTSNGTLYIAIEDDTILKI